jgi:hypothetical protein
LRHGANRYVGEPTTIEADMEDRNSLALAKRVPQSSPHPAHAMSHRNNAPIRNDRIHVHQLLDAPVRGFTHRPARVAPTAMVHVQNLGAAMIVADVTEILEAVDRRRGNTALAQAGRCVHGEFGMHGAPRCDWSRDACIVGTGGLRKRATRGEHSFDLRAGRPAPERAKRARANTCIGVIASDQIALAAALMLALTWPPDFTLDDR